MSTASSTAAAAISLTHSSCTPEASPSIPSDLLYRKMLPVADLDYELKALGAHGVAGSGTSLFWRLAAGSPRPRQHIRGAPQSCSRAGI
jgi:hypothetical protein